MWIEQNRKKKKKRKRQIEATTKKESDRGKNNKKIQKFKDLSIDVSG